MSKLVFVDHNGRPLTNESVSTSPSQVETSEEDPPLHVIAALEAQRQSTRKKVSE